MNKSKGFITKTLYINCYIWCHFVDVFWISNKNGKHSSQCDYSVMLRFRYIWTLNSGSYTVYVQLMEECIKYKWPQKWWRKERFHLCVQTFIPQSLQHNRLFANTWFWWREMQLEGRKWFFSIGISSRNSRCLCFAMFMNAQIGQTRKHKEILSCTKVCCS